MTIAYTEHDLLDLYSFGAGLSAQTRIRQNKFDKFHSWYERYAAWTSYW